MRRPILTKAITLGLELIILDKPQAGMSEKSLKMRRDGVEWVRRYMKFWKIRRETDRARRREKQRARAAMRG